MSKSKPFIAKLFNLKERNKIPEIQDVSIGSPNYSGEIWGSKLNDGIGITPSDVRTMKSDSIVGSALKLIMDTAFKPNSDNHLIWVSSKYDVLKRELDSFHESINLDDLTLKIAYNLLLWGNIPIKHVFDSENSVMIGVKPIGDYTKIKPIILNNDVMGYFDDSGYCYPYEYTYAQLAFYKDLGGPNSNYATDGEHVNEFVYAPSYLSNALKPWRNMNIIQDALLLSRLDKSQYYRIIEVVCGTNPTAKPAIKLANYYRNLFKKVRRVSYNSNNMASNSLASEFEVVIPTSSQQSLKVTDLGGQTEVSALADLDQVVSTLFAALQVSPSQIGYSEDTPSSLGDSAGKSWDIRLQRLCSSLVYSVQLALRHIDYVYLLSKGYEVSSNDWKYNTVSTTHLEDMERAEVLESCVESLDKLIDLLKKSDLPFNYEYLIQKFAGSSLESYGVVVEELFKEPTKPSEPISGSFGLSNLKKQAHDTLIRSGLLSSSEKEEGSTDSDEPSDKISLSNLKEITSIYYQDFVNNPYGYKDIPVILTPDIVYPVKVSFDKGVSHKNIQAPIMDSVLSAPDISFTTQEFNQSTVAPIEVMHSFGNKYYFENKKDLITYLSMKESGFNDVYVLNFITHKEFNYE